ADVADGAHAQADQIALGVSRIAHEVALQSAGRLGARQLIGRKGEVVHADVRVAALAQLLDGELQQLQLLLGRRQLFGHDLPLRLEHLRQVRIAVDGEAIGPHRQHRVQRACESADGLARQSVDEIEIYRTEAGRPTILERLASLLDALYPVDGLLHFRVEVLHADAGAIEAHPAVRRDVARLQEAWVELYREVAIGGRAQAEVARQAVEQLLELRRPQEIRR